MTEKIQRDWAPTIRNDKGHVVRATNIFLTRRMASDPEIQKELEHWLKGYEDCITAYSLGEYPSTGTGLVSGHIYHFYTEHFHTRMAPFDKVFVESLGLERVHVRTLSGKPAWTYFQKRDLGLVGEPRQFLLSCCE